MNHELNVFFDGDCPLCRREINWLRKKDPQHRVLFTDLAADDFDAAATGKSHHELMDRIHGQLPDGTWLEGIDLFVHLYRLTGLTGLSKLMSSRFLRPLFNTLYTFFARHRLSLTGRKRCDVSCKPGVQAP